MLALTLLGWAGAAGYQMDSVLQAGGKAQPLFAWCDAPDGVYALTQFDSRKPLGSRVQLYGWPKRGSAVRVTNVTMGESDGAAGSIFYPFGTGKTAQNPNNYVRISNVENVLDPAYRMTHVGEFNLGGINHRCRYVPDAVFMGVTAQRTVIIWEGADNGATYATRNFNGQPGVSVKGTKVAGGYQFRTSDGYLYTLTGQPGQKRVEVRRGGKLLRSEVFRTYSESVPR